MFCWWSRRPLWRRANYDALLARPREDHRGRFRNMTRRPGFLDCWAAVSRTTVGGTCEADHVPPRPAELASSESQTWENLTWMYIHPWAPTASPTNSRCMRVYAKTGDQLDTAIRNGSTLEQWLQNTRAAYLSALEAEA